MTPEELRSRRDALLLWYGGVTGHVPDVGLASVAMSNAADTIERLQRENAVLTANLEIMCPGGEAELAEMREKAELVEALNVSEALRRQEVAELKQQIKSLLAASVSR